MGMLTFALLIINRCGASHWVHCATTKRFGESEIETPHHWLGTRDSGLGRTRRLPLQPADSAECGLLIPKLNMEWPRAPNTQYVRRSRLHGTALSLIAPIRLAESLCGASLGLKRLSQ